MRCDYVICIFSVLSLYFFVARALVGIASDSKRYFLLHFDVCTMVRARCSMGPRFKCECNKQVSMHRNAIQRKMAFIVSGIWCLLIFALVYHFSRCIVFGLLCFFHVFAAAMHTQSAVEQWTVKPSPTQRTLVGNGWKIRICLSDEIVSTTMKLEMMAAVKRFSPGFLFLVCPVMLDPYNSLCTISWSTGRVEKEKYFVENWMILCSQAFGTLSATVTLSQPIDETEVKARASVHTNPQTFNYTWPTRRRQHSNRSGLRVSVCVCVRRACMRT